MEIQPGVRVFDSRIIALLVVAAALVLLLDFVRIDAAALTRVRDLVSTSVPSASANHAIQFTATSGIPASGSIVITPQAGAFGIPAGFDYLDVDVSVSAGGPYTDRTLAASASATEDGVSVVSGSAGSITITLSSTGISAGESVRITLGTDATTGGIGDSQITNPSTTGSYRITLATRSGGGALDGAQAMIAIVTPVTTTLENENTAPILSNGLPSGTIAAGNSLIELSLETTEPATCRYSTTPGVIYSAMTSSFTSISGQLFYTAVSGHVNDTSYTYYVRCADLLGVVNSDDYEITFTLDETPISNTSIVQSSTSGNGGVGPFPNGSSVLYLSSVTLMGWSSPGSTVHVLKDGTAESRGVAGGDGAFESMVTNLERGAYTFTAYAVDSSQRKSSLFSTTLSLSSGTNNTVSDIVVPPTIELSAVTVDVGEGVTLSGESVPGSTIELFLTRTGSTPKKFTTVVGEGAWEFAIDADDLSRGTYGIHARTIRSGQSESEFSETLVLGVGGAAAEGTGSSDLNNDAKVNLVDFSIMLSFWGTSEPAGDINADGTVNLADFSILLFNWTG
ncbi:MAG: dockerin type I domain-containing protein [Minisyncoccia bacterium]